MPTSVQVHIFNKRPFPNCTTEHHNNCSAVELTQLPELTCVEICACSCHNTTEASA